MLWRMVEPSACTSPFLNVHGVEESREAGKRQRTGRCVGPARPTRIESGRGLDAPVVTCDECRFEEEGGV